MLKVLKDYWVGLLIFIGFLIVIKIDPFNNYDHISVEELESYNDLSKDYSLSSIIVDKYVATGQYFYVFNSGDSVHFSQNSSNQNYSLNLMLQIGDSVLKDFGSDTIRVIRESSYGPLDELFLYGKDLGGFH